MGLKRLFGFGSLLLGAGLTSCQTLPEDAATGGTASPTDVESQAAPIITAGGDFSRLRNTATPMKQTCDLTEILDLTGVDRFIEAFECGDALFSAPFNELDGIGARVGQGRRFSRFPRADLNGPLEWNQHFPRRITGPNAQSCADCHVAVLGGGGDGPGGINTHAIRDPNLSGDIKQWIERQTPHLFGMAMTQLVAQEITTAIQAQARAAGNGGTATLTAKGISFGTVLVAVDGDGRVTATQPSGAALVAINNDLVVRPFQWKGSVAFVRDFVRGAGHNELGMQAAEMAGENVDGDGDGISNELTVGDMSAFASYMSTQPRPVTKLELNTLGLNADAGLPALTPADIASINAGLTVFNQVGCNGCHTPQLVLNNPVSTEPSQHPAFRDNDFFPEGSLSPISVGVDPANPISANLITDLPDNRFAFDNGDLLGGLERNRAAGAPAGSAIVRAFTDFRRHFMGTNLAEQISDDGVAPAVWFSRTLWGVGTTAPYLHDGRATTIMSAILEHALPNAVPASEAAASIAMVRTMLSPTQQRDLVNFLNNLVLFLPAEE